MSQDISNSKILRKHSNKFSGRSDCSIVPGSFYLLPPLHWSSTTGLPLQCTESLPVYWYILLDIDNTAHLHAPLSSTTFFLILCRVTVHLLLVSQLNNTVQVHGLLHGNL